MTTITGLAQKFLALPTSSKRRDHHRIGHRHRTELRMASLADFARLETECDFYEALPGLIKKHGADEVKESMRSLPLTVSQIDLCFKQLAARQKNILWLHCKTSAAGALNDLAIVITDQSLNEVGRNTWVRINGDRQPPCTEEMVNGFLREHCVPNCTVASGTDTARHLQVLARALPAVRQYVGEVTIDLSRGGVCRYAELLGLPMLAASTDATRASADGSVDSFEARMRVGDSPTLRAPLAKDASAEDHCEAAILALGWAREHLVSPPKAARYVTLGLHAFSVLLVGSIMHAVALWMAVA